MAQTRWIFPLITFLGLCLFNGMHNFLNVFSEKFLAYFEFDLNSELIWEEASGTIQQKDLKDLVGKISVLYNGSVREQTIVYERENDFNVERILVAQPDLSKKLLKYNSQNNRWDVSGIRISPLVLESGSKKILFLLSMAPTKTITLTEQALVKNNGRTVNAGWILSRPEAYLYALLCAAGGILVFIALHQVFRPLL